MNLEERVSYLQQQLNKALQEGASQGDVYMYESAIAELIRINDWIMEQISISNRVYFESDGRKYILFKNTSGIDFRFLAMKVSIVDRKTVVDTFEVATANWKAGKWARLYFDADIKEGSILRIDANSVEYQVMSGKVSG